MGHEFIAFKRQSGIDGVFHAIIILWVISDAAAIWLDFRNGFARDALIWDVVYVGDNDSKAVSEGGQGRGMNCFR